MMATLWGKLFFTPRLQPKAASTQRIQGQPAGRVTFCEVLALPENVPAAVTLQHVSENELGLEFPGAVEPGTFLAVRLEGAKGFKRLVRARVARVTPRDANESAWLFDCVLIDRLRPTEVDALR
jgi:hypothetical protein